MTTLGAQTADGEGDDARRRGLVVAAVGSAVALGLAGVLHFGGFGPASGLPQRFGLYLLPYWGWVAWRVGGVLADWADPRLTDSGVVLRRLFYAIAFAISSTVATGLVHRLDVFSLTVLYAGAALWAASRSRSIAAWPRWSIGDVAASVRAYPWVAIFVGGVGLLHLVNTAWAVLTPFGQLDDFTYHLAFPLEWVQQNAIVTRLVPFGNHAPSYHPKNVELLHTWLFLPARRMDLLPLLQAILIVGISAAVYDILRMLRAARPAALAASCVFFLSPIVARYLDTGFVEFGHAFFFLMAVNACLTLQQRPSWRTWAELWLAIGYFCGAKSFGLVLSLAALLPFLCALVWPLRARARELTARDGFRALALAVIAWVIAGGWWYLRNLIVAGNPIFPMQVELFGVRIFEGAYARTAFDAAEARRWIFVVPWPFWIPLAIGAGALLWRLRAGTASSGGLRARELSLAGFGLAAVWALVFVFVLPSGYMRFAFAIAPLASMLLVAATPAGAPLRRVVEALLPVALGAMLVDEARRRSILVPLLSEDLIPSAGVIAAFALVLATLVAAVGVALIRTRHLRWLALATAGLGVASATVVADITDPSSEHIAPRMERRWRPYRFLADTYGPVSVAVTGTNQSYRAYGPHFENRVAYVNINDSGDALFHDHFFARRVLQDEYKMERSGARYYRSNPNYDAWLENLRRFGADVVLIARIPEWAESQRFLRDDQGYPVESIWALDHPESFKEVFRNQRLVIFELL